MRYSNGLDVRVGDVVRLLRPSGAFRGPKRVGHKYTISDLRVLDLCVRNCPGGVNADKLELLERAWIHNEGKAPDLPPATRVDILYMDGSVLYNAPFGGGAADEDSVFVHPEAQNHSPYGFYHWRIYGGGSAIHAYREHVSIPDKYLPSGEKPDPKERELEVLL